MRVDHPPDGLRSRIGDAPLAGAPVVIRNILEQPLDGVVDIAAFVSVGRTALVWLDGSHYDKIALGLELASHVLVDKDEPFPGKIRRRAQGFPVRIRAVRG